MKESLAYKKRVISDVFKIAKKILKDFLVTMDIGISFDLWSQSFNFTLESYGFRKNLILWVKILLRDEKSCVINNGTTAKYFSLWRGAPQGDPISALYLF